MDEIKKLFDDFTFNARVMPALVTTIPIVLFGLYKSIINTDLFDSTVYVFVIIIFITLYAYIARNLGKKFEEKMVKELGALPTTIILRFSDTRIDTVTKTRYHEELNRKINGIDIPMNVTEENNAKAADDCYTSAMNWLRNHANANQDKYPLVYKELKDYNFWRNLYGLKFIGIITYALIAFREIMIIDGFNLKSILLKPYPEYVALIVMVISILILFFMVTRETVQRKAFDYARTLVEVCERL